MNEFFYQNIFETKGIEYILTIVFFLFLIPFWVFLNRNTEIQKEVVQLKGLFSAAIHKLPKGLFFNKNHTWLYMEKTGNAKIGIDNLLVQLTGDVSINFLTKKDENVKKGDSIAEIIQGDKSLKIYSPVSGKVSAINNTIYSDAGLISKDPYGKGWMLEIEPQAWLEEIPSFFFAEKAKDWMQLELDRFKEFINLSLHKINAPTEQFVLQDGGELIDNVLSDLPIEVWNDFQKEFLEE